MPKQPTKESLTDTGKSRTFISVPMTDDLKTMLDEMALEDAGHQDNVNVSALVRKLIYEEWERRAQVKKQIKRLKDKGLFPHQ